MKSPLRIGTRGSPLALWQANHVADRLRPLADPRPGCIAVLWREDPQSWRGHVGLFVRIDGDDVVLLGGNQLGAVREHRYPRAQVLGWRWPA